MHLLLAAAECSPYARTGGLGDAVAGLAVALGRQGNDVTVAIPDYGAARRGWSDEAAGGFTLIRFGDELFARPGIYGDDAEHPYPDNWRRFGRFSRAVAELAPEFDLLHLHDTHVGPAALLAGTATVFTIHNASYPLLGPLDEAVALLGLPEAAGAPEGPVEWFGQANYLKAGIVGADAVTTVSPTHARELLDDTTSFGLAPLLRTLPRPLVGILNGIDTAAWDPATDGALPAPFTATDPAGRLESRAALLDELAIDDGFVVGNVGRMALQKGFQLLEGAVDDLIAEGVRFVFVGSGELDGMVDAWARRSPRAVAHRAFDEELARRVFAGVDAYLMPSRFEPCGLGQLYAMRYGAVPLVHLTGGLVDTVVDVDEEPEVATGFGFRAFVTPELVKTVRRARRYHAALPALWRMLFVGGMTRDWSWDARAGEYQGLYRQAAGSSPARRAEIS